MGNTSVVAGAKAEVGRPPPLADSSQIFINVELTPLCSSKFKRGPPNEQAQVLCYELNNLLKSTRLVSQEGLTIEEGKASWLTGADIFVDIYCLDYDGNIFDASLIALLACLRDENDDVEVIPDGKGTRLRVEHYPIPSTFALLQDYLIADPTAEEETLLSTSLTVIHSTRGQLCGMFKAGGGNLSTEQLKKCMEVAAQRTPNVVAAIEAALKN